MKSTLTARALSACLLACGFATSLHACALDPEGAGATSSTADITNGTVDTTHTSVAAMLVRTPNGYGQVCTGTLVAPRVVLTAAHCVALVRAYHLGPPVWITFDTQLTSNPTVLRASEMFAPDEYQIRLSASGNPVGDVMNPYDVGVLLLDEPVTDRPYARLAPTDLMSTVSSQGAAGDGLRLTLVGYGMAQVAPGGNFAPTGQRRSASVTLNSTTPDYLLLNTLSVQDNGGACFGDSGGPAFLTYNGTEYLVATAVGGDGACHALNWYRRTDTTPTSDFLQPLFTR